MLMPSAAAAMDKSAAVKGVYSTGTSTATQDISGLKASDIGKNLEYKFNWKDEQGGTVDGIVIGAVGGLGGQVVHAVEHVLDLLHGALGGLHQRDAVLDVLLEYVAAALDAAPTADGDTASFTLALDNGKSYNVELTYTADQKFVDANGKEYGSGGAIVSSYSITLNLLLSICRRNSCNILCFVCYSARCVKGFTTSWLLTSTT